MTWCGNSSKMTPVGTALHFRRENENSSSSADVLHKTKNLAISRCCFADDGNEMHKIEKRTCRACEAIVFTHLICKFVTFSLPSLLSLLKLPIVRTKGSKFFRKLMAD